MVGLEMWSGFLAFLPGLWKIVSNGSRLDFDARLKPAGFDISMTADHHTIYPLIVCHRIELYVQISSGTMNGGHHQLKLPLVSW